MNPKLRTILSEVFLRHNLPDRLIRELLADLEWKLPEEFR